MKNNVEIKSDGVSKTLLKKKARETDAETQAGRQRDKTLCLTYRKRRKIMI